MSKVEKLVPDSSVVVEGLVSANIEDTSPSSVVIHEAIVAELEQQAKQNKAVGFLGIDELSKLRELATAGKFSMDFGGRKPSLGELRHGDLSEVDSLVRELAFELGGTLMTADKVQARLAEAKGIEVILTTHEAEDKELKLDSFFDGQTMSVHLRENVIAYAKKGRPGAWSFEKVGTSKITREQIQDISREIIEAAGIRKDGFIEIERPGSTIVQLGSYRVVIIKPPFSDGWEITAVRPVKQLSLSDYKFSEKLKSRVSEQAEGILIAGAPGMGKSTFAQALAVFYAKQNRIVKTLEAPRDMVLPENVTQYAISHSNNQEIRDILLLSRPDNTVFDEMRNTEDFRLFADLRLAGIGMAGVVHATNPIDAIQRFVGRIELGVIPQIVDTVIFIRNGEIDEVLSLKMTVKVPSGMTEADLARPVVVVKDFETGALEYELYSYGEETVVIPVKTEARPPALQLASKALQDAFRRYATKCSAEMVSDQKAVVRVPENEIPKIIGRDGKRIAKIEEELGLKLDIQPLGKLKVNERELAYDAEITKHAVVFHVDKAYASKNVNIFVQGDYLLTANIGKNGSVRVTRKHKIGNIVADALNAGEKVTIGLS